MLTFLDRKYSSIQGRTLYSSLKRFSIRLLVNIVLPVYFTFFHSRVRKPVRLTKKKVIVSLTSFPERISKIWLVIECVLRQTYQPDMILLYLSKEQFPEQEKNLPSRLLKYQKENLLQIIFVDDDLRSHKKYYYAFQSYPNEIVILIDDDIFYVKSMIEDLIRLHREYPNSICCHRAYEIKKTEENAVASYNSWGLVRSFSSPTRKLFHTSGGGTLYVPAVFSQELFDVERLKELCFHADDVWLNFHAQLAQVDTVKSSYYSDCLPVFRIRDVTLKSYNVQQRGNDEQLENLFTHYKINSADLFE